MPNFILYPLAFVFALAILIAVHEFGHFWVARKLGVKVLRFSIGFGKPIWKKTSQLDGTEYILAAVPLGGYVKMLDEREGEVEEIDKPRAFNNKSVWTRFAIVAAGPLFNFLFAIIVFWILSLSGATGLRAIVGNVVPGSQAAQAGLTNGDQIKSVNNSQALTWNQVRMKLLTAALNNEQVQIKVVDAHGLPGQRQLSMSTLTDPVESKDLLGDIGIKRWHPPAVLGKVIKNGAADRAGLKDGDRILLFNGKQVGDWLDWVIMVRKHPGETIELTVDRHGHKRQVTLIPAKIESSTGETIGQANVHMPEEYVEQLYIKIDYNLFQALGVGVVRTWDMSVLMLKVLGRIATGASSVKNISGPLTIAQFAGNTASSGILPFLTFLAIVSISLGVLNLLPIPVLDGGHLFYYLIEMVTGKPVSEQFQATAQQVGIFLLVALMGLAFYNDILRLLS